MVGIRADRNTFGMNTAIRDCAVVSPPTTRVAVEANRYNDGRTVEVRREI
jgi:hypothetical protein